MPENEDGSLMSTMEIVGAGSGWRGEIKYPVDRKGKTDPNAKPIVHEDRIVGLKKPEVLFPGTEIFLEKNFQPLVDKIQERLLNSDDEVDASTLTSIPFPLEAGQLESLFLQLNFRLGSQVYIVTKRGDNILVKNRRLRNGKYRD